MKRIAFLLLILFMIPLSGLQSQEAEQTSRNELGIGIVSLFHNQVIYPYYPYFDIYYPYVSPYMRVMGIDYKRHFQTGALRAGTDLYFQSENRDNENSKGSSSQLIVGIHTGYEFHKKFNKIDLYYGADLLSHYVLQQSGYESKDTDDESDSEEKTMRLGIGPMAGIRYYIIPQLSLSMETQLNASYSQYHYRNNYNGNSSESSSDGLQVGFLPFGRISVNLHF